MKGADAGEIERVRRLDGARQMREGEVGQPDQRRAVTRRDVEEQGWLVEPIESVDHRHRRSRDERRDETGDQAHVVVEGQPTGDAVGSPESQLCGRRFRSAP